MSDPLIRNLGTICGSVAHCDPEGDWNSVLLATGADVIAAGPNGERTIPIADFVHGIFTNALADDEMVVEVRIPVAAGRSGGTYLKLERKVGDYATVAVAAQLELGDDGTISRAGIALTSVGPINIKATAAEAALVGHAPSDELFAEAAELAASAAEPRDDVRGTADWKRQVVRTYVRRGAGDGGRAGRGELRRNGGDHRHRQRHRRTPTTSSRGCCSSTTCATASASPAPTSAATRAAAERARCCSTAGR